ncbi:Mitochondrial substrate/solute carrier [Trinorchestia longiramus]|nr:Mitochondrial substrate/solute carrier [Trinorchestia longiramus]
MTTSKENEGLADLLLQDGACAIDGSSIGTGCVEAHRHDSFMDPQSFEAGNTAVAAASPVSECSFEILKLLHSCDEEGESFGASAIVLRKDLPVPMNGGASAAVTTPLDMAKTRIMLAPVDSPLASGNLRLALQTIVSEMGMSGLFAGVLPRTLWMSIGGFVFLGVYSEASAVLRPFCSPPEESSPVSSR